MSNLLPDDIIWEDNLLSPEHLAELESSAISSEIITERGYQTITDAKYLQSIGFAHWQAKPGLLIPIYDIKRKNGLFQLKPYKPRIVNKKLIKYETPYKSRLIIDVPLKCQPALINPEKNLYITEGCKKVDSLASLGVTAISLLGVWNWRGRNQFDGKTVLPDFEHIAWNGRQVYIIFDNDVLIKKPVQLALIRFAGVIRGMDASVKVVYLPNDSRKLGIDDWIALNNAKLPDLIQLVNEKSKPLIPDEEEWYQICSDDFIEALAEMNYQFSMNEMDNRLYVNSEPITDPIEATIKTDARDYGFWKHLEAIKDAYIAYGYANQFHPIRDWLDSLEYDGQSHFDSLVSHFQDTDNVFYIWLKRWMIGAIAKIYRPGKTQNMMLVLDGNQDLGKSYFAHWLCSGIPQFFIESPLSPENKDHALRLIRHFVWEVGELGATMRKADREALKFTLTQQTVTERRPYGKYDMTKPVTCSFIGTINNEAGFLNDPTGSRRFYTCELIFIDWSYTQVDVNQLWAEMRHHYKNGETWILKPDEKKQQHIINARYEIDSIVLDLFLKHFDYTINDTQTHMIGIDVITKLEAFGLKGIQRANLMELSSVLKRLGIKKGKRNGKNGYFGVVEKIIPT